ncbi:DUF819 domain-containing protein [Rossellomorea aquimaris]|uniref:DUF819 domain-containing protein n=1 Tax=Rossellomorea aquimaris TaxID=189382 RepID=A0A5D4UM64_9BACI|nr:DUF819 family protein [Rossellomorea aquimaris]TYS81770.1 DUF819 domain-containing protein [Rossellomorea aquimaris]TYS88394.1 DUF819 domain-containing protein [Rossellomorea aquimaris]
MIQDGVIYISLLIAFVAIIALAEKQIGGKFFKYVPGIVLIYIGCALLKTFDVFSTSDSVETTYSTVRGLLLPAMLMLMLLQCDLRKIIRLGPKMILTFLAASLSIVAGFTITYALFKGFYAEGTWKAFAALTASWTGGSANMVILQGILEVPENIFGYALIMDTVNYSFWVMFMFWLVPFSAAFNKWTKTDTSYMKGITTELAATSEETEAKSFGFVELLSFIGLGLFISALSTKIGGMLPVLGAAVNATTWTIIIASAVGLILAMTKIGRVPGSFELSKVMLYIVIALIASHADFSQLFQAPIYIISGFMILFFHGLIMVILAKLFKLDLFTMGIASLANIGGVASAPILAGTYHRSLIPVGILMGVFGSLLGTYFGILASSILSAL